MRSSREAQTSEDEMNNTDDIETTDSELEADTVVEAEEGEGAEPAEPTIDDLRQEAKDLFGALQRKAADLENLRKRHQKQLSDERAFGQSKILKDFADVFDDFHRALEHAGESGANDDLMKGVQLVHDKFQSVLGRYGVESFGEVGEQFDPNFHEALHRQEDATVPRNTVIQVFQRGYRLADRVLRPAGVVVSAGGPDPE